MKMIYRLVLTAGALLATSSAIAATPPPNFDGSVLMCGGLVRPKVKFEFGQTTSTATVRTTTDLPIGPGPYSSRALIYSLFSAAATRSSPASEWRINSSQQDGEGGVSQGPVVVGASTFKSYTCDIKGTATISLQCANGSYDHKTIERNWPGCGL